jgi:glucoamylase
MLTGERAHYELAAGHRAEAERLLQTLAAFANAGGLIPEQVWDAADIPERELFCGRPAGSAMPLVWAHAETIPLFRDHQLGPSGAGSGGVDQRRLEPGLGLDSFE